LASYYYANANDLRDITDGATHYHADYIDSPRWATYKKKTVQIDTHIFYR
jgi:spore germination cell wall hydrolase CwlJ-like protein